MNVVYFYNREKNAIVVPSPLAVSNGGGDATEPSYQATTEAISKQIGNNHFSFCSSLLGKGSGELHYTALFRENGKISIFDSKISEPNRFLNSSNAPTILEKAWGYLTAPFKTLGLWAFGIGKQINSTFLGQEVTIHRLGTQPMLNTVDCGFHSTGAILSMADLIDKGECSTEQITSAVISSKNHDVVAENILNDKEYGKKIPPVSPVLVTVAQPEDVMRNTKEMMQMLDVESNANKMNQLSIKVREALNFPGLSWENNPRPHQLVSVTMNMALAEEYLKAHSSLKCNT